MSAIVFNLFPDDSLKVNGGRCTTAMMERLQEADRYLEAANHRAVVDTLDDPVVVGLPPYAGL